MKDGKDERKSVLSKEEMEKFGRVLVGMLQQSRSVSDSEHYDHHVWIKTRIEADRERKEFWRDMRKSLARWGFVGLAGALLFSIWLWIKYEIKRNFG